MAMGLDSTDSCVSGHKRLTRDDSDAYSYEYYLLRETKGRKHGFLADHLDSSGMLELYDKFIQYSAYLYKESYLNNKGLNKEDIDVLGSSIYKAVDLLKNLSKLNYEALGLNFNHIGWDITFNKVVFNSEIYLGKCSASLLKLSNERKLGKVTNVDDYLNVVIREELGWYIEILEQYQEEPRYR